MSQKILIASTNQGKVAEITAYLNALAELDISFVSLRDYTIAEPDEPYETYLQNAAHKARYYAKATGLITLADDSGLQVKSLSNFPGVRTKDFVEEKGSLTHAFVCLHEMLCNVSDHSATFHTAVVLYDPLTDKEISFEAFDEGHLRFPAQGSQGFGFDPVFIPEGYDKSFAELGIEVKNRVGHRQKALRGLMEKYVLIQKA